MSPSSPTTPPTKHKELPRTLAISTSFGSIGPLQGQLRLLLGCSSHPIDDKGAALAFAHEGLPRPGRDLDCHHFVLDCGAPLLVLAVKHHGSCFYVLVNLADAASRQAFLKAYGLAGPELVMIDRVSLASSYMMAVTDDLRKPLRELVAAHEGMMRDNHLWLLRLGEVTSGLPHEFAKVCPDVTSSLDHHVLVLLGDHQAHFAGVREALRSALRRYS